MNHSLESKKEIAANERLAAVTWPALSTTRLGGWELRTAAGYSMRANSVLPAGQPGCSLTEAILHCEEHYERLGLAPTVFKLTEASEPPELDDALNERGYRRAEEVMVMRSMLPLQAPPETREGDRAVEFLPMEPWLAEFLRLNPGRKRHEKTMAQLLSRKEEMRLFACLMGDEAVVAMGMAVLAENAAGIYNIVTAPAHRRKGYAEQLMRGLLEEARMRGAESAFLQVLAENEGAVSLYAKLGFHEAYRQWYRVQEGHDG
ncbi:GNAT family N-acetyltransferase [Gorillibacterium sp. CAU 1737]|uniref:GNAT family N-acetyltransferase n=1 Tax=Gorillibacterium sp. CAU 1737 TaxID=3140362 RepID=UPI0032602DCA